MKIKVHFLGGSKEWQDKIEDSAKTVGKLFSNTLFLNAVANHGKFDHTKLNAYEVANLILHTREIQIYVGFYSNFFTRAIAYERNGRIFFNTRKEAAGTWANIMHESLHVLGFSHNGNTPRGNENSVPYKLPEIAKRFIKVI
jgi:hypothetical protein